MLIKPNEEWEMLVKIAVLWHVQIICSPYYQKQPSILCTMKKRMHNPNSWCAGKNTFFYRCIYFLSPKSNFATVAYTSPWKKQAVQKKGWREVKTVRVTSLVNIAILEKTINPKRWKSCSFWHFAWEVCVFEFGFHFSEIAKILLKNRSFFFLCIMTFILTSLPKKIIFQTFWWLSVRYKETAFQTHS